MTTAAVAQKPVGKLDSLKNELEQNQAKAAKLPALKSAIDVIGKNVEGFQKTGEALRDAFAKLDDEITQKATCKEEVLGDELTGKIDAAFDLLRKNILAEQSKLEANEEARFGDLDIQARKSQREAARRQKAFEQLAFKELTDQLSKAKALVAKADAITGVSLSDAAASYAWLLLADERLKHHWLVSEYVVERIDFSFPANYEHALVDAFNQWQGAVDKADRDVAVLNKAKAEFEEGVKALAAQRDRRDTDTIAEARKAAEAAPGKGYGAQTATAYQEPEKESKAK